MSQSRRYVALAHTATIVAVLQLAGGFLLLVQSKGFDAQLRTAFLIPQERLVQEGRLQIHPPSEEDRDPQWWLLEQLGLDVIARSMARQNYITLAVMAMAAVLLGFAIRANKTTKALPPPPRPSGVERG